MYQEDEKYSIFLWKVTTGRYRINILVHFLKEVRKDELQCGYFQQDVAIAHTARRTIQYGNKVISKGLWPPRLPVLSYLDFYFFGGMKNNEQEIESISLELFRQHEEQSTFMYTKGWRFLLRFNVVSKFCWLFIILYYNHQIFFYSQYCCRNIITSKFVDSVNIQVNLVAYLYCSCDSPTLMKALYNV